MKPYPTYRQREALSCCRAIGCRSSSCFPLATHYLLPFYEPAGLSGARTWAPAISIASTEAGRTAFRTPVPT